ncbi:MAG: FG-GAP-like repeat-containing protein [Bryobacteraceae bacterium]|nr:FG-GAP-like repeat-containing protein [Bryobacteraceae bacterium]
MRMRGLAIAAAACAFFAWILAVPAQPDAAQRAERLQRLRTLGKAYYENPTTQNEAVEMFRQVVEMNPDSVVDQLNYGLALLRAGKVQEGVHILEEVQKKDPSIPHTWFNLGIEYKRMGEPLKAIRQLEQMARLVPDEPITHYNLGVLYKAEGRIDEANAKFELAAKLDPNFAAPHFQLFNYYRQRGEQDKAKEKLAKFQDLKRRHEEAGTGNEDVEWSLYSEIYEVVQPAPPAAPPAEIRFAAEPLPLRASAPQQLLVLDFDGAGQADLLVVSASGLRLLRRAVEPLPDSAFPPLKDVLSAALGDFDNDGRPDLCVLTAQGPVVLHNTPKGFERTAFSLPQGRFETALWVDYDHDYDQDLLLLGEKTVLLRNQLPAGFADRTSDIPFVSGRAVSAVVTRMIPDTKSHDIVVSYAGRPGVVYRDRLGGFFDAVESPAIPPGAQALQAADLDNDSAFDLVWAGGAARNRNGRFEPVSWAPRGPAVLADVENRGALDAIAEGRQHRNAGEGRFEEAREAPGVPADAAALAAADFDSDGRVDLAAASPDGRLWRLRNETKTPHRWARVHITGVKNLKLAFNSEVEIRSGPFYQKQLYRGVPLTFGLRDFDTIDTVRITWPNGLIQNEVKQKAGATLKFQEAQRLSGSCPMIWTWNGAGFEFITDVLGVAPLGASAGDGKYFPVDHDEYVWIDGTRLQPREGRLEVRITEELAEVSYLDQIELIAVDHPAALEIFTNDKWKSPPYPEFRLFGASRRIYPQRVLLEGRHDVTERVLRRDRRYIDSFARDFRGVAQKHAIEIDFAGAAPSNRAVFVLHGWVDWADGSTFLQQAQSTPEGLVPPFLQAKNDRGEWVTILEDMGMPAGKPKTIAVDLTGKFPGKSRQLRIITNLALYWDEMFLIGDSAPPEARLATARPLSAVLRFRGFSKHIVHPLRRQPEQFFYEPVSLRAPWNPTPGRYTRFGDVLELITAIDDRMVIMGSGDELALAFDARSLPPLPAGWKRDWLLKVDGWAKDRDANTAFSQSVEPLPFHGMSGYPYGQGEAFPSTPAHREWMEKYNTRPALRILRALR